MPHPTRERLLALSMLIALLGPFAAARAQEELTITAAVRDTADRLIGRGLAGHGSSVILDSTTVRGSVARTLADLLTARVPGLNVTYPTGAPGYAPEITARGATGFFGPGRPLLYVDGILQREDRHLIGQYVDRQRPSHAWSLPTDEIESVEVVLGPAGGTLLAFGSSRGAVLVRTRQGTAGAWRFTQYTEASGASAPGLPPTRLTIVGSTANGTTDYCPFTDQATGYCTPTGAKLHRPFGGVSPYRASTGLRAGVGLGGGLRIAGIPVADVRLAANMDRTSGAVSDNAFERYDLSAIARITPWRSLRATLTTRFARTGGSYARFGENGLGLLGGIAVEPSDTNFALTFRVADSLLARSLPYRTDRLSVGLSSEWTPRPWLRAFAQGSAERMTRGSDLTAATYSFFPRDEFSGTVRDISSLRQGTSAMGAGVRGTRALPLGLRLAGEAGGHVSNLDIHERRSQERMGLNGSASSNETRFSPELRSTSFYAAWRLTSGSGRSIGGGFRKEATTFFETTFGDDVFNTLDATWTISQERFFPRIPGVDRTTLRVAYGESGDHEVLLGLLELETFFTAGTVPPRLPRTLEREAGLDVALFGGAATLGITAYDRSLRDGYFNSTATSGIGRPLTFASWSTHGAEWSLALPMRRTGPLQGNARLSWSSARTRITAAQFPTATRTLFGGSQAHFGAGIPFGAIYSTRYSFNNTTNDGIIDATEIVLEGAPTRRGVTQPTDVFGLTAELRWRDLVSAGVSVDGKFGHVKYDGSQVITCQFLICRDLYDGAALLAQQARAVASGYTGTFTGPVHDADFIRARDIWVRVALPSRVGPLALKGVSLTLAARNVGLWSRYPSGDPETGSFAFATVQRGDYFTPSLPATLSLRLDLAR